MGDQENYRSQGGVFGESQEGVGGVDVRRCGGKFGGYSAGELGEGEGSEAAGQGAQGVHKGGE